MLKHEKVLYLKMLFALLVILATLPIFNYKVSAEQFSWTENDPVVENITPTSPSPQDCEFSQMIEVDGEAALQRVCSTSGGSIRFGMTDYGVPLVSFGYDKKMYKLLGFCSGHKNCLYLPNTDTLISLQSTSTRIYRQLKVYKNFSSNLLKRTNENGTHFEYIPKDYNADFTFTGSLANPVAVGWAYDSVGASENERWLAFEARGKGMMRLDLNNYNLTRFSTLRYSYEYGPYPWTDYVISNDGSQIIQMGDNTPAIAFNLSEACGDSPTDQQIDDIMNLANQCPSRHLNEFIGTKVDQFRYGTNPEFLDSSGGSLKFYAKTTNDSNNVWVTLNAPNYNPPGSQLDYLALGDSYSSGEGDTETSETGQKYYLAGTDVEGDYANGIPREKCHQSWRAYPFLLSDYYNIDPERFETVACSGALIGDISGTESYEGQARGGGTDGGSPRLQGITNTIQFQEDSLEEFIPGRVRQLEFVEVYKPNSITVTMGGNDVGFGGKINDCVNPITGQGTCKWANTNKSLLGKQINGEFNDLVSLYGQLKRKSSLGVKVHVVGYPQIITDNDSVVCGANTGALNKDERVMISSSIEYMNDVIEAAAGKAGVNYIDIENSLLGSRLCEAPHPSVTGIAGFGSQESFHPNHVGNALIAEAIKRQLGSESLLTHTHCPTYSQGDFCPDPNASPPPIHPYFSSAMSGDTKQSRNVDLTKQTVAKNSPHNVKLGAFTLQPGSTASITLHSDPVSLGTVNIPDEGNINTAITIPENIPVGYHTIVVSGKTFSGEPIELTQTILVTGIDPDDLDENGISDTQQACGPFLEASGQDEDYDDIDDACDPEISETKPYRARMGDANKNENPNNIYIERNVKASSYTGISNDYDPDNDGWAIVAQSTKSKNFRKLVDFWVDDNKVPHIKVQIQKTKKTKCKQFTPKSLSQVTNKKIRKLELVLVVQGSC